MRGGGWRNRREVLKSHAYFLYYRCLFVKCQCRLQFGFVSDHTIRKPNVENIIKIRIINWFDEKIIFISNKHNSLYRLFLAARVVDLKIMSSRLKCTHEKKKKEIDKI